MRLSHTLIGAARTDQEVTAWSPSEGGPLETRQKDGLAMIWANACGVSLSETFEKPLRGGEGQDAVVAEAQSHPELPTPVDQPVKIAQFEANLRLRREPARRHGAI